MTSEFTGDWSNVEGKSAFPSQEKIAFYNILKHLFYFLIQFYCAFDQINAALASIRDFFQKYITH